MVEGGAWFIEGITGKSKLSHVSLKQGHIEHIYTYVEIFSFFFLIFMILNSSLKIMI